MTPEREAAVGLGGNIGDVAALMREALERIGRTPGVRLLAASSLYRTAPVDAEGPDYLNAVAVFGVTLTAHGFLGRLQEVETALGRVRPAGVRNAPRTLDLDLELFGDEVINDPPELLVPHPRMHERRFVLVPLLEVRPDDVVPGRGPARDLLGGTENQRIERLGPLVGGGA